MKCIKCGRSEDQAYFFKPQNSRHGKILRHGTEMDICTDCLASMIDANKPETFDFILRQLDVPFIEDFYYNKLDKWKKMGNSDILILGKYLAFMNLIGNPHFHYQTKEGDNT